MTPRSSPRAWLLLLCVAALLSGCKRKPKQPGDDVRLPDGVAGTTCERDADCRGGRCVGVLHIQAVSDAVDAPGGYCTASCDTDSQCGRGAECSVPAGEPEGECLSACNDTSPCRKGYSCVGASARFGFSGTCQPEPETAQLEDGVAGLPCKSSGDCGAGECAAASPLGATLPGNYCSARCLDDADCGQGGGCLVFAGSNNAGHCYALCSEDSDCTREGYRCRLVGPDFNACYPAPTALPDHRAGTACNDDTDCGGKEGSCALALTFGADDDVPAPGGYCTQACSLDSECGAGSQCIAASARGGVCLARCVDDADCRKGYDCVIHGRDLIDEDRVCIPRP
jgi:hypothetical protein